MSQGNNPLPAAQAAQAKAPSTTRWLIGGAVGIAIAAGATVGFMNQGSGDPALQIVAQGDIAALAPTLAPDQAGGLVSDAEACRVPLAQVMISHAAGAPDAVVKIQSGNYVSPEFKVTAVPEAVAFPFPGSYAVGSGVINVLGNATGMNVDLNPAVSQANINGALPIHVFWDTGHPCS